MEIVKHQTAPILTLTSNSGNSKELAMSMYKHVASNTPALSQFVADHETYPTIHRLLREVGEDAVFVMVMFFIEDCVRALSVNQPTKEQLLEIARELIIDNPTFKPEDFKTFFANVKKGKYGKDYNRFDISTVYQMLSAYNEERMDMLEQAMAKRKAEDNSTIRTAGDVKGMHELYDGVIRRQMEEKRKKEYAQKRQVAISKWVTEMHLHFAAMGITPDKITAEQDAEYRKQNPLDEAYIEKYIAQ